MYKRLFCFEKDNTIKASVLLLLLLFLNEEEEEEEEEAMLVFLQTSSKTSLLFFCFFFVRKKREKKREMRSKRTLFEGVFFPSHRMGSLKKRFLTTKISTTAL